jgi:hypothetical protein
MAPAFRTGNFAFFNRWHPKSPSPQMSGQDMEIIFAIIAAPAITVDSGKVSTIFTFNEATKKAEPWLTLPCLFVNEENLANPS